VFTSVKTLASPFDQIFDNQPVEVRDFNLIADGAQYAAYAELRWRALDSVTIDLGLRWDYQSYTTAGNDAQSSPRVSVLYQPNDTTELRLGWGQYSQAQEVNELQVSDGSDRFYPAQRAEHVVLNLRRRLSRYIAIDVSIFEKSFRAVRPRFENAFNQLSFLPEIQFDRVMIDPDSAVSRGGEILVSSGLAGENLFWWIGYTWSEVEDRIGEQAQKRAWDQTQTAKFGASWRWKSWDFSLAGEMHTGWPKTELMLQASTDPGGNELLLLSTSPYNGRRHSEFHALDVRVSRDFAVRVGELELFLEVSNLFNRSNPCCTEYALVRDAEGNAFLDARTEHWLPLVPSVGVTWTF
jgi:hypothetical protein